MNLPVKRSQNELTKKQPAPSSLSRENSRGLPMEAVMQYPQAEWREGTLRTQQQAGASASASARGAFAFESMQEPSASHAASGSDPSYDAYSQSGSSAQYNQYNSSGPNTQSGPYAQSGQYSQQAQIDCAMHPGRTAEAACVYCGKFFCAECLVEVNGRMYCKGDVEKVLNETRASAAHSQPQPFVQPINIYNDRMNPNGMNAFYPYKKQWVAALLCLLLGYFGVHRFYVGKVGTGLLWLFTFGFGGIGVLLDLVIIICGGFRDKRYMPLV